MAGKVADKNKGRQETPRRRCSRCGASVIELDAELLQCAQCNARDLRIAGLHALIDGFEPDDPAAKTYASQLLGLLRSSR